MTTRMPDVEVSQILTRSSQAIVDSDLLPCVVGPIRDVVNNYNIGDISSIVQNIIGYPDLKSGAIVDTSTVKVVLKNGYKYLSGFCSISGAKFTGNVGENFLTANSIIMEGPGLDLIKPGDVYYLNSAPNYKYTIKSIDGDKVYLTSYLKINITESLASPFMIIRQYDEWDITSLCVSIGEYTFHIASALDDISEGTDVYERVVNSGTTYVSYVAKRPSLSGFYIVDNLDQLKLDMSINSSNPIGYYLGVILPAANGNVKSIAYITKDDTLASFLEAYEALQTKRDTYYILPISTNSAIQNALASHVNEMSDPEFSQFRVGFVNATLTTQSKVSSNYTQTIVAVE